MTIPKKIDARYKVYFKKHWLFLSILTYCVGSWWWLLDVDIASLASSTSVGKMMQIFVLLVVSLVSTGIYSLSLKYLFRSINKSNHWSVLFKLMFWWAATELFVSWVVCIIWYGVGGKVDNVLPFTVLGHFAIWTPLGFLSRFVGLYGLSGIVFMVFVMLIVRNLRKFAVPVLAVVGILTALSWGIYRAPSGPKVDAVVVGGQSDKVGMHGTVSAKGGSLVILPEYAFTGLSAESMSTKITSQEPDKKVYFVSSRFAFENDKVKNQLVAGDTHNGYTFIADKSRLIPGGEYMPYAMDAIFTIVGSRNVVDDFRSSRRIYTSNDSRPLLIDFDDIKVGAGICSSIIAPEDYRNLAKNGANIFTNSAHLGVFNGSKSYDWHHRSMSKFLAIANARSLLQATNKGPTFGIDSNGKQLFRKSTAGMVELEVSLNNTRTPYSIIGEYIAYVGFVWIVTVNILRKKRRH